MKIDWHNWNSGGKTVFIASCVAIVSMFISWVDVGIASQNGLMQGTFLFLGLWIYPALMLISNKSINIGWGLACSITSLVVTLSYIGSKSVDFFGKTVNVASTGAWLFLFASIALIVGVVKYNQLGRISNSTSP